MKDQPPRAGAVHALDAVDIVVARHAHQVAVAKRRAVGVRDALDPFPEVVGVEVRAGDAEHGIAVVALGLAPLESVAVFVDPESVDHAVRVLLQARPLRNRELLHHAAGNIHHIAFLLAVAGEDVVDVVVQEEVGEALTVHDLDEVDVVRALRADHGAGVDDRRAGALLVVVVRGVQFVGANANIVVPLRALAALLAGGVGVGLGVGGNRSACGADCGLTGAVVVGCHRGGRRNLNHDGSRTNGVVGVLVRGVGVDHRSGRRDGCGCVHHRDVQAELVGADGEDRIGVVAPHDHGVQHRGVFADLDHGVDLRVAPHAHQAGTLEHVELAGRHAVHGPRVIRAVELVDLVVEDVELVVVHPTPVVGNDLGAIDLSAVVQAEQLTVAHRNSRGGLGLVRVLRGRRVGRRLGVLLGGAGRLVGVLVGGIARLVGGVCLVGCGVGGGRHGDARFAGILFRHLVVAGAGGNRHPQQHDDGTECHRGEMSQGSAWWVYSSPLYDIYNSITLYIFCQVNRGV